MRSTILGCFMLRWALAGIGSAQATEFYIGEPAVRDGVQIVPNYLLGIEMDRMPPDGAMGPDTAHLEPDVDATKEEQRGFLADAWIPDLTINFTLANDLFPHAGVWVDAATGGRRVNFETCSDLRRSDLRDRSCA